jgi:uncharacterized 2Fe-2S/4Fe-4S cluster protein (DUF4445 family)
MHRCSGRGRPRTTNAAGFLIDLRSGKRLASLGIENPQAGWGADLVSRINHAIGGAAALEELRAAAATAIDALAHDLALAVGARPQHIVEAVICGNTAMHHLLLGLPVRQLGRAPFVAAARPRSTRRASSACTWRAVRSYTSSATSAASSAATMWPRCSRPRHSGRPCARRW